MDKGRVVISININRKLQINYVHYIVTLYTKLSSLKLGGSIISINIDKCLTWRCTDSFQDEINIIGSYFYFIAVHLIKTVIIAIF